MNETIGAPLPDPPQGGASNTDASRRRYHAIGAAIFTGIIGKIVQAVVGFLSVSLTVRYLGAERYGLWLTMSSFLSWIYLADLGIGNSLINNLSESLVMQDYRRAAKYTSNAFWSIAAISAMFAFIAFAAWPYIDWSSVFGVQSDAARRELPFAIALLIAIFLLNLPFTVIQKVFSAFQKRAVGNLWEASASIASLFAVLLVIHFQGNLVWLVAGITGSLLCINICSAIYVFFHWQPALRPTFSDLDTSTFRSLAGSGFMFFAIQVSGMILFQTDNLIIAHYLGASHVTPYAVTLKLFNYATLLQLLIMPAAWPALNEAYARGDFAWMRQAFRANLAVSVTCTTTLSIAIVLWGKAFIHWWAGPSAVPATVLLYLMAAWTVLSVIMNAQATVLSSTGNIHAQVVYAFLAAICNLGLSIWLVRMYGGPGVIASTLAAYLIFIVVPQTYQTLKILRFF